MKMPPCHRYPSVDGILASLRLQPQRMICTRHKDSTESKDLSSPVSPGGCSNIRAACYRSCVLRHRMVKQYCCPCVLRRLHPELDISFARPNSRQLDTFAFNNLRHRSQPGTRRLTRHFVLQKLFCPTPSQQCTRWETDDLSVPNKV